MLPPGHALERISGSPSSILGMVKLREFARVGGIVRALVKLFMFVAPY